MQNLNNRYTNVCLCVHVCRSSLPHWACVVTYAGARSAVFAPIFTACSHRAIHTFTLPPSLSLVLFWALVSRSIPPFTLLLKLCFGSN